MIELKRLNWWRREQWVSSELMLNMAALLVGAGTGLGSVVFIWLLGQDESIGEALQRMGRHGIGRIPVVTRSNANYVVGLIARPDIVDAYNTGLARRAEAQHRAKQMQVQNIDGAEFVNVTIQPTDDARGHTIGELAVGLPRDCVLVSVRRNGQLLIPHGNTVLQTGDQVTAFVSHADREAFLKWLHHDEESRS